MTESRVQITVADGEVGISDRIDGELVVRAAWWLATFRMVRTGGVTLPACRVCGTLSPADLHVHALTHTDGQEP